MNEGEAHRILAALSERQAADRHIEENLRGLRLLSRRGWPILFMATQAAVIAMSVLWVVGPDWLGLGVWCLATALCLEVLLVVGLGIHVARLARVLLALIVLVKREESSRSEATSRANPLL